MLREFALGLAILSLGGCSNAPDALRNESEQSSQQDDRRRIDEIDFSVTKPSAIEGFPVPAAAEEVKQDGYGDVSYGYRLPGATLAEIETWLAQYVGKPFKDWQYCGVRSVGDVRWYDWTRNPVGDDAETLVVSVADLPLPLTITQNRRDARCET